MKFSYNYRGGKEEVICHTHMRKLDSTSWKIMRSSFEKQTESYFLPVNITEGTEGYTFVYDMRGMVNFRAWMYEAIEKEQIRMRKEIIEKQRKLFEMGISQEQLITEDRYMYVDEKTQHIKFICVPVISETGTKPEEKIPKPVHGIEAEVKYETEPALPLTPPLPSDRFMDIENEDSEPVVPEYPDFQQNEKESFERNYAKEEEETADFYGKSARSSFQENGMQLEKEEIDGSETILGFTQPTGVNLVKEEKEIESPDLETEKLQDDELDLEDVDIDELYPEDVCATDDEDGTVLLMQETDDDGEDKTTLLRPLFQIKASLHRVRTGEMIKLNKNITAIGKSGMRADIVIEENPTISRKHCTIYFEGGTYYLEDNDSSNGTWLEDQKVRSGQKIVLKNGSKIRLSDEEFIFHIG